jgi:hypothetical protein
MPLGVGYDDGSVSGWDQLQRDPANAGGEQHTRRAADGNQTMLVVNRIGGESRRWGSLCALGAVRTDL